MELLSTSWFVLLLYCSEWLTIRRCFGIPVPTLSYYPNGYVYKNSWKYGGARYPGVNNEKFVFPSKLEERRPYVAERSETGSRDTGKIFFPDELDTESDRIFQAQNQALIKTSDQYRPSSTESSSLGSGNGLKPFEHPRYSVDGSLKTPNCPNKDAAKDGESDARIREALREFYKWLRNSGNQNKQKGMAATNQGMSASKGDSVISEQTLVSALKNQECKSGEIRVNGDCKRRIQT